MTPSEAAAPARSRSGTTRQLACVAVYLLLCIGTGLAWEPTHDEGVAWRQAIGQLSLPPPEQAAPIARLYATLDSQTGRSAADVFDALMVRGGMHPPAYYLLLHWWSDVAGTSRIALNAPAYLLGVLSLFGIHRLARRLVPVPNGPIWAMTLMALSPWFIGFSNLAKPYAIVICLSLWGAVALLNASQAGRRAGLWRGLFVALSILGVYSIYHYAFVVVWQGALALLLAWRRPDRQRAVCWVVAMGVAIVAGLAPWAPRLLQHLEISAADPHYFSGLVPLAEWPALIFGMMRIWGLGEALRSVGSELFRDIWTVLAIATAPLAIYAFTPRGRPAAMAEDRDAQLFGGSVLLRPLAIVLGDLWRGTHTLFISKLSFGLFPIVLLVIVRAWHAAPRTWQKTAGLTAWALLFFTGSTASSYSRATSYTPFEAVVESLAEKDTQSHLVLLSSKAQGYVIPLLLTARDARLAKVRVAYAPAEQLWPTLERAAADASIERVTLVDLAVTYRPQDLWRAKTLHALQLRAERASWRVARFSPGVGLKARQLERLRWSPESAGNPGKSLVITELANVKYYSMEVAGNRRAILMRP